MGKKKTSPKFESDDISTADKEKYGILPHAKRYVSNI
jgi:hypothetical protein